MRWLRSLLVLLVCGLFSTVLFEGGWPDHGAATWVVFIAGLVVIALGSDAIQGLVERRRSQR